MTIAPVWAASLDGSGGVGDARSANLAVKELWLVERRLPWFGFAWFCMQALVAASFMLQLTWRLLTILLLGARVSFAAACASHSARGDEEDEGLLNPSRSHYVSERAPLLKPKKKGSSTGKRTSRKSRSLRRSKEDDTGSECSELSSLS